MAPASLTTTLAGPDRSGLPGPVGRHDLTPGAATDIGEWYLRARSAHRDDGVIGAYRELQTETDRLFVRLTQAGESTAVRVAFTGCLEPYSSDQELIAAVRTRRTLEVTSAAVHRCRLHPLLDCDFGGGFDRFRAVHDLVGHAWCGFGFAFAAERAAWLVQHGMHGPRARLALAAELLGVNAARSILGEPPELKALLLDPDPYTTTE
ncbi:MAG: hypothetical protein ACLQRH_00205 [Acidimicrobiales bacterium]